jgi:hypothetical protein
MVILVINVNRILPYTVSIQYGALDKVRVRCCDNEAGDQKRRYQTD